MSQFNMNVMQLASSCLVSNLPDEIASALQSCNGPGFLMLSCMEGSVVL